MYLEVSPAGGKLWRFKYRYGGKEKRLSLGTYPEEALTEAREKRDAFHNLLANGIEPSANVKAERAAQRTLRKLAFGRNPFHSRQQGCAVSPARETPSESNPSRN